MGQKNPKGSVTILNDAGRIRLRWRYKKQRFSKSLFEHNKKNLLLAKKIAISIETDMEEGNFDCTLIKYEAANFRNNSATKKVESAQALELLAVSPQEQEKTIVSIEEQSQDIVLTHPLVHQFENWVKNYRNMDCDKDCDYYSTRGMMKRWGSFDVADIVTKFNEEAISASTYNRRLGLLKNFFNWTTKQGITAINPLDDVLVKKVRKQPKPKRKPFSEDEIKSILEAFKNDTYCPVSSSVKHSHYYPFVYFIFSLGTRNGEAIGLRVSHVDVDKNLIHIKESLSRSLKGTNAAARIRKETKNGKERVLPMSDGLKEVLKSLIEGKNLDDLVFTSPNGVAIDDHMFQKRVFSKVLQGLEIAPRNLYAARHTFGSRCIEAGLTPVMTAFLMGNNPETALRNYTHQISFPENLPKV